MRALWAELTPDAAARQRAFSLDGVSEEVLFTLGPLLVTVVASTSAWGPSAALALSAGLNVAGAVGLATASPIAPTAAPAATRPRGGWLGPLRDRRFQALVGITCCIGVGTGPLEVSIVARADEAAAPAAAGVLVAAVSAGSIIGGLLWGRRQHQRPVWSQLSALAALLAIGMATATAVGNLPLLALVLVCTGTASTPVLIVAYLAADRFSPGAGRTEATTWVSTANNVGIALGAGLAGVVIDDHGAGEAMGAGAVLLLSLAVVIQGGVRRRNDVR
jgi:predicted MFS family arabinose efflux permease